VSIRVLHAARHITGHFGDESFQTITCTGTDNTKQTGQKIHQKPQNKVAIAKKYMQNKSKLNTPN